jgi:putative phosphoesterase
MLLAIVSDTHCKALRRLPAPCLGRLTDADLILHAGDFTELAVVEELRTLGPRLEAVHGNVDAPELRGALPGTRIVEADGARIGMVHDAGPSPSRLERMRARFPDADAVVFGHSHMPLHEESGGFQIFNPGSPTQRRRAPAHTMGLAHVEGGRVRFELVRLD